MHFRSSNAIKREFLAARKVQPSAAFLAECCVNETVAEQALALRAAIARLAGVQDECIWADDTFERDLINFDFWGSLDSIVVASAIEKALGLTLTTKQLANIPDPESVPGLTVAEFTRTVLYAVYGNEMCEPIE